MTPELHRRAKELFLAVCELNESERSRYLDAHCGDDPALRAEVESLLPFHTTLTLVDLAAPDSPTIPAAPPSVICDRWAPGTVVAERYRIVNLLGRGGMGEVYRAEDTRLTRTVALKCLTTGHALDPVWLNRFYTEARTASTITHRYVCRTYDVGEADGFAFISMEYVDGENLAALLRRVGRLSPEKVIQVARQLCQGLAAAHDRGVLHRDLKPANVMLDARGEVRLTDFGIAVSRFDPAVRDLAGTPAYMAPELLLGQSATVRSDIYALGLILYQLVTGTPALRAAAERSEAGTRIIPPPSGWAPDLDARFERCILDCLEPDPQNRPASVYQVLAAIPGTEVMAEMLAAGETPPVDVVAAAATESPGVRLTALVGSVAVLAGVILALLLAGRVSLVSLSGLLQPSEVLGHKAAEILQSLGWDTASGDVEQAFVLNHAHWDAVRGMPKTALPAEQRFPVGREVICYRYAVLGRPATFFPEMNTLESGPPDTPVAELVLDGAGRLRGFVARRSGANEPEQAGPLWDRMFGWADLRIEDFAPTTQPARAGVDSEGTWGWRSAVPSGEIVHVSGTRNADEIRFEVAAPPPGETGRVSRPLEASSRTAMSLVFVITFILAVPLAWQNLLRRRSDRRGALQIAVVVFGIRLLLHALDAATPRTFLAGTSWLVSGLQTGLFAGFMVWIYYLAIEPYVRQFWPHSLISWTRLLTGRARDPLVGRDVLIGCAVGVGTLALIETNAMLALRSSHPYAALVGPVLDWELGGLSGIRFTISSLVDSALHAVTRGLLILALVLMLRLALRNRRLALAVSFLVLAAVYVIGMHPLGFAGWVTCGILSASAVIVLDRAGYLAFLMSLFVSRLLLLSPLTLDMRSWYAGQSWLIVAIILFLAGWALHVSLRTPQAISRFR